MVPVAVTAWMERDATPVSTGAGAFTVRLPGWGRWLRLMDATGAPDAEGRTRLDPGQVLRRWLLACVRDHAGRPLGGDDLDRLPSAVADPLLDATLDLVEAQRRDLAATIKSAGDGLRVELADGALVLRGWSFGERARHLRRHLQLASQGVALDVAGLEIAELACCGRWEPSSDVLSEEEVGRWPLVLGEEAAAALASLNQQAENEDLVLQRCLAENRPHPDLDLAVICRSTGLAPSAVEALPARQAARLAAALRLIEVPAPSAPARSPVEADSNLTRILVRDG